MLYIRKYGGGGRRVTGFELRAHAINSLGERGLGFRGLRLRHSGFGLKDLSLGYLVCLGFTGLPSWAFREEIVKETNGA